MNVNIENKHEYPTFFKNIGHLFSDHISEWIQIIVILALFFLAGALYGYIQSDVHQLWKELSTGGIRIK